jgi:hypothetical protein
MGEGEGRKRGISGDDSNEVVIIYKVVVKGGLKGITLSCWTYVKKEVGFSGKGVIWLLEGNMSWMLKRN